MGSRLGVIIRSENGWELYYDLGGVGARPPLARPSRSGYRLSRRAAPSDVHPTAPNSSAPGTSSGPRSRASRSGSRNPIWRCGVEPPLMSYCAFTARNIPGLTGDRRDGARGLGTTRDGTVLAPILPRHCAGMVGPVGRPDLLASASGSTWTFSWWRSGWPRHHAQSLMTAARATPSTMVASPWNLVIRSSMSAGASERRARAETLLPFSSVFARM